MLPRDEGNIDRADLEYRRIIRPTSTIAVERETQAERDSQSLVNETIQIEQTEFIPVPKIQDVPGISENDVPRPDIEEVLISVPEKIINPVRVIGERTTISGVLKERMGVANRRARVEGDAIPDRIARRAVPFKIQSAYGLPVNERSGVNTPVKRLSFLDQFFNWLNAFLS